MCVMVCERVTLMMTETHKKRPARLNGRGAIIVYGHRLSSLYRRIIEPWFGYETLNIIVSKILKSNLYLSRCARNFLASGGSISETMKGAPS